MPKVILTTNGRQRDDSGRFKQQQPPKTYNKPTKAWVKSTEMAAIAGVTSRCLRIHINKGKLPPHAWSRHGIQYRFHVKRTLACLKAGLDARESTNETNSTNGFEDRASAEARKASANADIAEIKRDQIAQTVVPIEEVKLAYTQWGTFLKKSLQNIPIRLAGVVTAAVGHEGDMERQNAVRIELETEIDTILTELCKKISEKAEER